MGLGGQCGLAGSIFGGQGPRAEHITSILKMVTRLLFLVRPNIGCIGSCLFAVSFRGLGPRAEPEAQRPREDTKFRQLPMQPMLGRTDRGEYNNMHDDLE